MAGAITKELSAKLSERIRQNMIDHVRCENEAIVINDNRKAIADARVEIVVTYGRDYTTLVKDLRTELRAFPTGSDQLKARKQSWKRSFAKAFNKVNEGFVLTFKQDTPIIGKATVETEKTWSDRITEIMTEAGASDKLIAATIRTYEKEIEQEAKEIERVRAIHADRMKQEKARSIADLKAQLEQLEKTA